MSRIRLATRGSALALAQSGDVARALERVLGRPVELVAVQTSGDRLAEVSLAKLGGKGLFIKEIEEALLSGQADFAVHSAKDLPARLPDELELAAFPERADARDALIARDRRVRSLADLPPGARIGTGSLRRGCQLARLRPDLVRVPLRGNVTTRIEKLVERGLDALVLACAGLDRLGLSERIDARIDAVDMLPAVGQGILALEARRGSEIAGLLRTLDHAETRVQALAERAVLRGLDADCSMPLAAHAQLDGTRLRLRALLADPAGERWIECSDEGARDDAEALGARLVERLLASGGRELIAALRSDPTA